MWRLQNFNTLKRAIVHDKYFYFRYFLVIKHITDNTYLLLVLMQDFYFNKVFLHCGVASFVWVRDQRTCIPGLTLSHMVRSLTGCGCPKINTPSYYRLSWWILMCWIQPAAVQHAKLTHNTDSLIWLHPSPAELKQKPSAPLPPPSGCFHRLWTGSWLLDQTRRTVCPLATWTAVWRAAARLACWLSGAMVLGVISGWGWGFTSLGNGQLFVTLAWPPPSWTLSIWSWNKAVFQNKSLGSQSLVTLYFFSPLVSNNLLNV